MPLLTPKISRVVNSRGFFTTPRKSSRSYLRYPFYRRLFAIYPLTATLARRIAICKAGITNTGGIVRVF